MFSLIYGQEWLEFRDRNLPNLDKTTSILHFVAFFQVECFALAAWVEVEDDEEDVSSNLMHQIFLPPQRQKLEATSSMGKAKIKKKENLREIEISRAKRTSSSP